MSLVSEVSCAVARVKGPVPQKRKDNDYLRVLLHHAGEGALAREDGGSHDMSLRRVDTVVCGTRSRRRSVDEPTVT